MKHVFIINPTAGKKDCTACIMEMAKAMAVRGLVPEILQEVVARPYGNAGHGRVPGSGHAVGHLIGGEAIRRLAGARQPAGRYKREQRGTGEMKHVFIINPTAVPTGMQVMAAFPVPATPLATSLAVPSPPQA